MRTNIEIDDELMAQALKATGKTTKKDVVEAGLRTLIRTHDHSSIRESHGKVEFWPEVIADREKYDVDD
jgi:Arc/MetJ family transcription regulator